MSRKLGLNRSRLELANFLKLSKSYGLHFVKLNKRLRQHKFSQINARLMKVSNSNSCVTAEGFSA